MDPNATIDPREKITPENFSPGYYNLIIPPELYKSDLSLVDLSRDVLNCSLCPNVDCKSKKVDIDTSGKKVYFIIDKFFIPNKSSPEYSFILNEFLKKYPDLKESDIHITPSFKTEGGNAQYCADFTLREILINQPEKVYYFSDYIPAISNQINQYWQYEYINQSILFFLPNIDYFMSNPLEYNLQQYL